MKQLQAPKTLLDRPIHLEKNHKPLETLGPRAIIKNGNKSAPTHRRTPQGGLGQGKGGGGGLIRDDGGGVGRIGQSLVFMMRWVQGFKVWGGSSG